MIDPKHVARAAIIAALEKDPRLHFLSVTKR